MVISGSSRDAAPEDLLAGLIPGLWRAAKSATRAAEGLDALPPSIVEIVRRVAGQGPSTPATLAREMHLARSTVSNLVRDGVALGLLERRPSADDGRSVLIAPTDRAHAVLAAFGRGRVEVIGRVLDDLPDQERERVVAALPALRALIEGLNRIATSTDARDDAPRTPAVPSVRLRR